MLRLESWLRLMMLMSRMAQGLLMRRAAINIAVLLILAVLVGAMLATLLVIGLYAAYQQLLQRGVSMDEALLITAGIAALLALVVLLIGRHRVRKAVGIFSVRPGLTSKVDAAAQAFMDGLLAPSAAPDSRSTRAKETFDETN